MLKTNSKAVLLILGLIIMFSAFLSLWSPASKGQSKGATRRNSDSPVGKAPVADFLTMKAEHDDSQKSFNASGKRKIVETKDVVEITEAESSVESLSTIPVAKSDLIIRATIINAKARISEDETTVYSEFITTLSQIIRGKVEKSRDGTVNLSVFRVGGGVRFGSGHVQNYTLSGAGAPEIGGDYILFLKWSPSLREYDLLTALRIEDSRVQPIDLTRDRESFNGKSYSDLIDYLSNFPSNIEQNDLE